MRTNLALLIIYVFASSCAMKELKLENEKLQPITELTPAKPTYNLKGKLQFTAFVDARPDQSGIGYARTGLFMRLTSITLDTDLETYVRNKFISRLMAGGIDVLGDGKYLARGVIRKLWITEKANDNPLQYSMCDAEIEFQVTPKSNRGATYRMTVTANARSAETMLDTTEANGPLLETCVLMLVDKFIGDPELQKLIAD